MFGAVAGSSGISGRFITSNCNSVLRVFRICLPFPSTNCSDHSDFYKDEVILKNCIRNILFFLGLLDGAEIF